MKNKIKGICVALCTPFTDDGESLDETALMHHLDYVLGAGIENILVCGGTGEFAYLRPSEKNRIVDIAARHIAGRANLLVQTSTINTKDGVESAKRAEDSGADCLMVLPPYFEGPNGDGVYYHYETISRAVSIPIMVYNIPAHSGFDISPGFFTRLLEIDNIQYIKDSTGDIVRIEGLLAVAGSRAGVFNGGDPIAFYGLVAGCSGCVWGAANVMPRECVALYSLVKEGRLTEAADLWKRMLPANMFFWKSVYNVAVKTAVNLSGRMIGPCRKPQMPLREEELQGLKQALAPLGI